MHKSSMELVSILVITYNAEKYIERTIKSCLEQTYDNLEVLVLDNNSKDETISLLRNIKDPRLKVFQSKENMGPYGGLNYLLDRAKGGYVAIQDHDDVWFSRKIEEQVDFMEECLEYVACGAWVYQYFEGEEVLIRIEKKDEPDFVNHTTLLFRSGPYRYDTKYILADEHFQKKVLQKIGKIFCLQEALVIHRIRQDGANLSATRFKITPQNIKEYFRVNTLNLRSFLNFSSLILRRFFPDRIVWLLRRNIIFKNNEWLSAAEFKKRYPEVLL